MISFEGLDENFRFLVQEVENQVRNTMRFLQEPSPGLHEKIVAKDDYIDNLKTIIENKCYSKIHTDKSMNQREVNRVRAVQIIGVNLERIADYCVNIVRQTGHLRDYAFINNYQYMKCFDMIVENLGRILSTYRRGDLSGALRICKAEHGLDALYKDQFDLIMDELETGSAPKDRITVIFIFRYLERIGDSLLNIGEALIFFIIGEKIKIEQFESLQQTLSKSGFEESFSDIDFQAIWGTRSGCRIGRVDARNGNNSGPKAQSGIYKEGTLVKIRKEKENLEYWDSIFPGLTAEVYNYHEEENRGSLLVEFLPGCTLDQVVLNQDDELIENALFVFENTVRDIWETTLKDTTTPIDYMDQLRSRQGGVLQSHPGFKRTPLTMGKTRILSTEQAIVACAEIQDKIPAPFSVFIHGDSNINNIVYDHAGERIHYIDLYRSRDFDYVQDVSVFLVSNFRIPIFETALRGKLNDTIQRFFDFAQGFATAKNDTTFQARLALALARSFYTSTRFELHTEFAKDMYLRSHYLMDRVIDHRGKSWEEFRLPMDTLFY